MIWHIIPFIAIKKVHYNWYCAPVQFQNSLPLLSLGLWVTLTKCVLKALHSVSVLTSCLGFGHSGPQYPNSSVNSGSWAFRLKMLKKKYRVNFLKSKTNLGLDSPNTYFYLRSIFTSKPVTFFSRSKGSFISIHYALKLRIHSFLPPWKKNFA